MKRKEFEPPRQVEVQLGHLCNNRCVFCVSGQLSEQKRAPQLPAAPIRRQLGDARRHGATKITFLGGEPTLQRSFLDLLDYAVELGFEEVVIFTNGVMTPRDSFRERVYAVLQGLGNVSARVVWRFSLQGGTRAAHDATTLVPGSWDKILQSLAILHEQGARLTGNLCVVESNWRSVASLAAVAAQFGLENLHLDMIRPRDAGDRTDDWLRAIMVRYTDMAPVFVELEHEVVNRLGADFDLNFGNVPYCTMPAVTHRIHHDGQDTVTVAADGQGNTQEGFNKYEDKRRDKHKPASCAACVFDATCSGVFDKYREFYGDAEFVPVLADDLWRTDAAGHHFVLLASPVLGALADEGALQIARTDDGAGEIEVHTGGWRMLLRRPGRRSARHGWLVLQGERFEAVLVGARTQKATLAGLIEALATIARALASTVPPVSGTTLETAWRAERTRLHTAQRRQEQALRTIKRLVEHLHGIVLAGLQPDGVQRAADGLGVAMRFVSGNGALVLSIRAEAGPGGEWRPRFRHTAHDLPEATVAAFNQALGGVLQSGLYGSRSPPAQAPGK